MTEFDTNGYVVLPIFNSQEIKQISQEFLQTALNSPELVPNLEHLRFVMGAVGYCPFASLTYNPLIRYINRCVYEKSKEIFQPYFENEKMLLSMLPDRPLIRFPTQKVNEKGKWHQDDAANATPEDKCYGGWVNLNYDETQYFKCIPGTHISGNPIFDVLKQKDGGRRGYANFKTKEDYDYLEHLWKEQGKKLVEIPPGHALIFRETLIHSVFKNPPTKQCILRQHISFILSENPIPLHDRPTNKKYMKRPKLLKYFEEQAVVPVRSGQETPVFSPFNLFPNNKPQLEELSTHYIDACKKNGIVQRYLPSMKEINTITGIPMCEPMTDSDIMLYIPHKL